MRCSFILGTSAIETLACLSTLEVDGVTWADGRELLGARITSNHESQQFFDCLEMRTDIILAYKSYETSFDGSSALGMVPPLL